MLKIERERERPDRLYTPRIGLSGESRNLSGRSRERERERERGRYVKKEKNMEFLEIEPSIHPSIVKSFERKIMPIIND